MFAVTEEAGAAGEEVAGADGAGADGELPPIPTPSSPEAAASEPMPLTPRPLVDGALPPDTPAGAEPPPIGFCTAAFIGAGEDGEADGACVEAAAVGNVGFGIALPFGVNGLAPGLIGIVEAVGTVHDGI